jgi:hypothetical protein
MSFYEISYFIPAVYCDTEPRTMTQVVEAPAHRKGVLNSDLVKFIEDQCWNRMVETGHHDLVGYVAIREYRPARIGFRNGSDNPVARADLLMSTKIHLLEDANEHPHMFFTHALAHTVGGL